MLLEGKTVLVSGVGPGLGREIAVAAAREGANLVLGARREENLKAAAAEADPSGERVAYRATDITDPAQVEALVGLAKERFGGLDVLVNCAALDSVMGGLEATAVEDWRAVFEVNVFATVGVVRAALPLLKDGGGSVVFIGSQSWMKPPPEALQIAYAGSKAAQAAIARHLAQELGQYKIRVNTVSPSWMWGPPVQGFVQMSAQQYGIDEDTVLASLTSKSPLQTMAADEDVAEAVVFLASDRARAISGQTVLLNAGEFMT